MREPTTTLKQFLELRYRERRRCLKTIGVIYANSGHENFRYIKEAEISARSFRRYIPEAEYVMYTQAKGYSSGDFDHILETRFDFPEPLLATTHKNGQMVAKLNALADSRFDITLYLDSDTYALSDQTRSIIGLMDEFDIAVAHAPHRINNRLGDALPDLPASFPEFNCGLILFRNTPKVMDFIRSWRDVYVKYMITHAHDQGAFRRLIYAADIRVATLPPEFNYRGYDYNEAAVILHKREMLPRYIRDENGKQVVLRVKVINFMLKICRSRFRLKEIYWGGRACDGANAPVSPENPGQSCLCARDASKWNKLPDGHAPEGWC